MVCDEAKVYLYELQEENASSYFYLPYPLNTNHTNGMKMSVGHTVEETSWSKHFHECIMISVGSGWFLQGIMLQRVFTKSSWAFCIASSEQAYFPASFEYWIRFHSLLRSFYIDYAHKSYEVLCKITAYGIINSRAQVRTASSVWRKVIAQLLRST
jgi:hypothetical protein